MYNNVQYNEHVCNYKYNISSIEKIIESNIIAVTVDLGFDVLIRQKIRLLGIEVPNSKSIDIDEKQYALLVKQRITEWCYKYLIEDNIKYELRCSLADYKDNDGNLLGELWCVSPNHITNINKWLCDNNYAVPSNYDKNDIKSQHKINKKIIKSKGEYYTYTS